MATQSAEKAFPALDSLVNFVNRKCLLGEAGLSLAVHRPPFYLSSQATDKQRLSNHQHPESPKHLAILPATPSKETGVSNYATPYQDTSLHFRLHLSTYIISSSGKTPTTTHRASGPLAAKHVTTVHCLDNQELLHPQSAISCMRGSGGECQA